MYEAFLEVPHRQNGGLGANMSFLLLVKDIALIFYDIK
jgi:hypothetical protein